MNKEKLFLEDCKRLLKDRLLTEEKETIVYSYDATPGLTGETPIGVAFPKSTEEVRELVKFALEYDIPLYPRGAGTSVSGGPVPKKKGLVVSFQQMNQILEIDPDNMTALVEPGVVVAHLDKEASKFGLMYPPDPGSVAVATIGGTVAENAGGLRGLKYGVTKDYVMGMELVLPNAEIFRFGGKCVKNVTGYNFSGFFVGSEGTIGLFTQILLKLIPAPKYKKTFLATFDSLKNAGEVIANIIRARIIPATLEIMDNFTIKAVENYLKINLPTEKEALLLIELDGMGKDQIEEEAQIIQEIIKKFNGDYSIAKDEKEREKLWQARRAAFPALARLKPAVFIEDVAVPRTKIVKMLVGIQEISKKYNLPIATVGHAGDGNVHPMILIDPQEEKDLEELDKVLHEIVEKALSLKGTITGEHGIGIAKKKYILKELGHQGIKVMRMIKNSFDSKNIINPEKIV
ncbi:FAD linked oxidase domain protein [Thermodesulfatator indicus DSM 15286]|uniref:FAD linked oxidase domain protein n=1 Tax=Thermodesulfatator indicus (strain DSM 15286 / JCM 11887 / CIR29812) TaxID=667014 RepID=F8AD10_THEID|nr:FAD-linked oxidase C-terminal domain-containing protein [Thermodesulfatator indicus]AEH45876.1 FAD linked oxidase domain protein [Thermodesulfatator indicus DSM 15286]